MDNKKAIAKSSSKKINPKKIAKKESKKKITKSEPKKINPKKIAKKESKKISTKKIAKYEPKKISTKKIDKSEPKKVLKKKMIGGELFDAIGNVFVKLGGVADAIIYEQKELMNINKDIDNPPSPAVSNPGVVKTK